MSCSLHASDITKLAMIVSSLALTLISKLQSCDGELGGIGGFGGIGGMDISKLLRQIVFFSFNISTIRLNSLKTIS